MLGAMMEYPLTLTHILDRARRLFPTVELVSRRADKTIHRTNYGEVTARALKLAGALQAAGLKRGERVATLMWNHAFHVEAYFGIPLAGGVLHTLNLRLHPDDLSFIATHAKDRFLIVDESLLPLLEKFRARAPFEKVFVVRSSANPAAALPEGLTEYEALVASGPDGFVPPVLDENEACGLCYTSGTTGAPKGALYSHRSTVLHSLVVALGDSLDLRSRDTMLPVVPMFHVNAWGLPYAAALVGARQVHPGPFLDPINLLELFEQEKVTVGAGVPTVWMAIVDALDKEPTRWKLTPGMRMVIGGAAAPKGLIVGLQRHGLDPIHAWGMTEMSPVGTVSKLTGVQLQRSPEEQLKIRLKQGTATPLVDLRAVDENGKEAPWDGKTQGELHVRGPFIAARYFENEQASRERWTSDGWFMTGDVVTIDPEGFVEITDRSKDLVKSGGEWISSVALENALMGHPAIKEAAVIAVKHEKWSERPLAAIVFKEGKSATDAELAQYLMDNSFAKFQVPDAFVSIDAVPRTSTGKFLKSALRTRFKDYTWQK
jgi:fatty-acyl-CoA synthase